MSTTELTTTNHTGGTYPTYPSNNTYQQTWVDPYTSGYACPGCGQWVNNHRCHQCYPYYQIPVTVVPNIIVTTAPVAIKAKAEDTELREEIRQLSEDIDGLWGQMAESMEILQSLMDLAHNKREEVRGHTEGERESADSGGVPGAHLEAPKPRGDWAWPKEEEA